MNMIEKVGRILCEYQTAPCPNNVCKICRDRAKAAIEAMREPTDRMIKAGLIATAARLNIKGSQLVVNEKKMHLRYQAMIDAALKE